MKWIDFPHSKESMRSTVFKMHKKITNLVIRAFMYANFEARYNGKNLSTFQELNWNPRKPTLGYLHLQQFFLGPSTVCAPDINKGGSKFDIWTSISKQVKRGWIQIETCQSLTSFNSWCIFTCVLACVQKQNKIPILIMSSSTKKTGQNAKEKQDRKKACSTLQKSSRRNKI